MAQSQAQQLPRASCLLQDLVTLTSSFRNGHTATAVSGESLVDKTYSYLNRNYTAPQMTDLIQNELLSVSNLDETNDTSNASKNKNTNTTKTKIKPKPRRASKTLHSDSELLIHCSYNSKDKSKSQQERQKLEFEYELKPLNKLTKYEKIYYFIYQFIQPLNFLLSQFPLTISQNDASSNATNHCNDLIVTSTPFNYKSSVHYNYFVTGKSKTCLKFSKRDGFWCARACDTSKHNKKEVDSMNWFFDNIIAQSSGSMDDTNDLDIDMNAADTENEAKTGIECSGVNSNLICGNVEKTLLATCHMIQNENGTGVHIGDGYILTCAHVVAHDSDENKEACQQNIDKIGRVKWVIFANAMIFKTKCVAFIEDNKNDCGLYDIALLKIIDNNCDHTAALGCLESIGVAEIADEEPNVKDQVFCVGNPSNIDLESGNENHVNGQLEQCDENDFDPKVWYLSFGYIESKFNKSDRNASNYPFGGYGHSCFTYWGHSGGPVFDRNGKLVALHSSWDEQTGLRHSVDWQVITDFVSKHI